MSELNQRVENLHAPLDKTLLRAVVIIMAFVLVILFMWEPQTFADNIGGFSPMLGILFVWAICASMVYGVGFKPIFWLWQITFSPYLSISVLGYVSFLYWL
ncbi:cyd operon protein YbgE [Vibrio tapetis subsp. quintayensis]|uniref:cyd operon protein YbgE n=1 Tax=Vibrio tapetis TaxID=52443 RepID=UPI0025B437A8|nr:cyd operon protein YbgE [Vibrio tapetis]MDN3682396.1 cyd operon protein YbgE [Vibrio tapetis subsp. quintayensis]